jgi:hypothetical protein
MVKIFLFINVGMPSTLGIWVKSPLFFATGWEGKGLFPNYEIGIVKIFPFFLSQDSGGEYLG